MNQNALTIAPATASPTFELSATTYDDSGMFGPESTAWRVWSHPAAFLGVTRSLMADMLSSPEAAEAVANGGAYKADPIGRAQRTMHYFLSIVYGDMATVERSNLRLARLHQRISGLSPVTRSTYSARDPLLMLGTHVMTWHSVWLCYEKFGGQVRPGDEERFFAESVRAAAALGLTAIPIADYVALAEAKHYDVQPLEGRDSFPATRAEFALVLRAAEPGWAVTPQTRTVLNTLLRPQPAGAKGRQDLLLRAYPILSDAAAATLPRRMRSMAGLPTSRVWEARALAGGRTITHLASTVTPIGRALREEISPRGYALMREAQAASE